VSGEERDGTRERLAALGEIAAEIAHELRNVLQIVSSSAYVARQDVDRGDSAAARPHLDKVEKYARIAHTIVDDLMLLARGDALSAEPVLVAEVLVAARADVDAGTAEWDDRIEPYDLRVQGHPGLLARLLHVLYENAVHASAKTPCITTRAHAEADGFVIEVHDDGPGVPADIAPRVFDPLVTARKGGTGLGLALASRIAAAHGGSIALADPVEGEPGARFRIVLPRQR
jgi:two-component system sensor histidine kinase BaeS